MVEVGLLIDIAVLEFRDAEAWEINDAINENTACVFYVANSRSRPSLREVTEVAHNSEIPVLVDAAAQIPPIENLRRFITEGADLVTFSGGKAIRGHRDQAFSAEKRILWPLRRFRL